MPSEDDLEKAMLFYFIQNKDRQSLDWTALSRHYFSLKCMK